MKTKRHLRSIGFGTLFAFTYAVLLGQPELIIPITMFGILGVLVPNLDFNFKLKATKQSWIITGFLIPFLIYLIIPRTIYIQAMILGYTGHIINDLDKKNNITFAIRRAYVGALWVISLMIIMTIFQLNLTETMQLFQ